MAVTLIPLRTLHFSVPVALIIPVFRIVLDNEISYVVESVNESAQSMRLLLRIDLSKGYQRNAVPLIEQLVSS